MQSTALPQCRNPPLFFSFGRGALVNNCTWSTKWHQNWFYIRKLLTYLITGKKKELIQRHTLFHPLSALERIYVDSSDVLMERTFLECYLWSHWNHSQMSAAFSARLKPQWTTLLNLIMSLLLLVAQFLTRGRYPEVGKSSLTVILPRPLQGSSHLNTLTW